jgi:hypothetical protein
MYIIYLIMAYNPLSFSHTFPDGGGLGYVWERPQ